MSTASDDYTLDELTRDLRKQHGNSISYQRVWRVIIEGDDLGYRTGQRWRIPRGNRARVEAALGLTSCQVAA